MSQAPPDKQQQQKQKKHKKKRKSKQAPSETQETEEQPGSTYTRPRDLASRSDWLFCAHSGDCLVEQPETERFCSPWGPTYSVPLDDITHHTRIVESDMEKVYQEFQLDPSFIRPPTVEEAILADRTLKIRATIDERCPECDFTGMEYYTKQLRSADEGQTVFFECPNCRHKWSTNN